MGSFLLRDPSNPGEETFAFRGTTKEKKPLRLSSPPNPIIVGGDPALLAWRPPWSVFCSRRLCRGLGLSGKARSLYLAPFRRLSPWCSCSCFVGRGKFFPPPPLLLYPVFPEVVVKVFLMVCCRFFLFFWRRGGEPPTFGFRFFLFFFTVFFYLFPLP